MALVLVDLDLIDEDPRNPRGEILDDDVADLKQALLARGQEDPMHLIPRDNGRYFLHEGHRRLRAMRELGWKTGKAIERRFADRRSQMLSQGQMHAHRRNWGPMAWADYCHRLFFEEKMTREDIARELGVSQAFVRDSIALTHLTDREKKAVAGGTLSKKDALARLARRRAERDGRPAPALKKTASKKPAAEPHLNAGHRLAEQVAARCASGGIEHAAHPKIGGVGCGVCWEDVIRADAIAAAKRPVLAAA